jgi:hypothetical protein
MAKSQIDFFNQNEEIKSELLKLNNNFTELFKQLSSIVNSIRLVYEDRDLLKDIYTQGESTQAAIRVFDKHNETLTQDVKADVLETKDKVGQHSESVKDVIQYEVGEIKEGLEDKNIIKKKGLFNFLKKGGK